MTIYDDDDCFLHGNAQWGAKVTCHGKALVLRRVRGESSVHRLSHTSRHVWLRVFRKMKFKSLIIIVPCRKFGMPFLGMSTAAAWAALPIPVGACSIVVCPNECIYGCQCLGFLTLSAPPVPWCSSSGRQLFFSLGHQTYSHYLKFL